MFSNVGADIRYGLRGFARRPLFAVVIVLTLSVGIGVNTAVFSIFEQLLLRPLPVSEPERLAALVAPGPKLVGNRHCGRPGNCDSVFSYPMFRDLERVQEPFTGIAAHYPDGANLTYAGQTRFEEAVLVSGDYFTVLGVQPALGRLLGPQDDRVAGEAESVVLSYAYWQSAFGADPNALGQTLAVNGRPLTVVGVTPEGFEGVTLGTQPRIYVPITFTWSSPGWSPNHDSRSHYWMYLFARLRPGVSIEHAEAALNPAYQAILNDVELPLFAAANEQEVESFRTKTLEVASGARGQSSLPQGRRTPLLMLLAATGSVLLIACVNIANMMLARGATRVGEMAVRASMGAARGRLVSLLLTEAFLLASLAALVSLPITLATLQGVLAFLPSGEALAKFDFDLSARVVAITIGVAVSSAVLFGLFPAFALARTEPARVLQAQGARTTGGRAAATFRMGLVTAQIALSMTLLVLAALFTQSLANIARIELGMRTESLLVFSLRPEFGGTSAGSVDLFDRVEEELATLPGVMAVTSAMVPLLADTNSGGNVSVEGFEPASDADAHTYINLVGSEFLRTFDIPLLAGRDFSDADSLDRPKVAIVNETFAEHFGLYPQPVGKRIGWGATSNLDVEIIGVARDAKYSTVKREIEPQLFLPRRQSESLGTMSFYVRSLMGAEALMPLVPQVVARVDPSLPVTGMRTLENQIRENVFADRFAATLAASLAALATLLAALGLYGVFSYLVAQRTREMGLRLALGAPPQRLRGMLLRQVVWLALAGGSIGIGAALLVGRSVRALLFGLAPTDPLAILGAAALLGAMVLGAGYWPARRAAHIDPMAALRCD